MAKQATDKQINARALDGHKHLVINLFEGKPTFTPWQGMCQEDRRAMRKHWDTVLRWGLAKIENNKGHITERGEKFAQEWTEEYKEERRMRGVRAKRGW